MEQEVFAVVHQIPLVAAWEDKQTLFAHLGQCLPCGIGFWMICPSIYSLAGSVSGSLRNSSKVIDLDGVCSIRAFL